MTDSEKQREVADRVAKLNDLRSELTVANAKLRNGLLALSEACRHVEVSPAPRGVRWKQPLSSQLEPWPTKAEVEELRSTIERLRGDAGNILKELSRLGLDPALFKLNGD